MTKINISGVVRDMTASEEEAEHEEAHKKMLADKKVRTDARAATATKKASGKQKLKDLGLDDDEIKALTGA